ncbi:hypothetical protein Patl_3226 [Paraglaciecola sp. T6c]|uniref:type II secretion system protein GspK n=1 Tax=Pseudoalteromonas atlantica (strain T6c / ATCC BAA-1087) TaxID=3042615 RepID=UPI0000DA6E4F|nr:type II secretion system protein GspK [Paraglaciecola sp. T6c]ABG41732.1 hypothetical protein Patl_3226 [Paraglaciecola sp. T6c]
MIKHSKYRKNSGAALLAVLIVSVVMVILLGVATTTLNSRLALADQSKQMLHDLAQVYAKENQLTYLIATQRVTEAGLSQGTEPQGLLSDDEGHWLYRVIGDEIRADGETIKQEDGLSFSLQNEAGLIPINSSTQYWLKRYLRDTGYDAVQQSYLGDILADYADADNWRRPAGAERSSYKGRLFQEPANFLLQSCTELRKLMRWDELLQRAPQFLTFCSLSRSETINLNAMPIALWELFWPNSAKKVESLRDQGRWLTSVSDMFAVEPSLSVEIDDYFSRLGGSQFIVLVKKGAVSSNLKVERGRGSVAPYTIRRYAEKP